MTEEELNFQIDYVKAELERTDDVNERATLLTELDELTSQLIELQSK